MDVGPERLVAQFLSPAESSRARPAVPSQIVTLRPLIHQVAHTLTFAETGHRLTVCVPESLPFALGDAGTIRKSWPTCWTMPCARPTPTTC
jgi:hypothetical protein